MSDFNNVEAWWGGLTLFMWYDNDMIVHPPIFMLTKTLAGGMIEMGMTNL